MPQFDIASFFNQVFWLSIFFSVFYFLILKFFLPDFASCLKARYKKEKFESMLLFNDILSYNKTKLVLKINNKLARGKPRSCFSSAL